MSRPQAAICSSARMHIPSTSPKASAAWKLQALPEEASGQTVLTPLATDEFFHTGKQEGVGGVGNRI